MEAESIPVWTDPKSLSPMEMVCEWCGTQVPLQEGEFCGVCIDCGMVMFREGMNSGHSIPDPDERPAASAVPATS